jgi:hypothetical protein
MCLVLLAGDVWICKPSELNQGEPVHALVCRQVASLYRQRHLLGQRSARSQARIRPVGGLGQEDEPSDERDETNHSTVRCCRRWRATGPSSAVRLSSNSYISKPLLVDGKKFDIRCYMLISNVQPLLVFYHPGYIRLSMFDFDEHDDNLLTHLTNQVGASQHSSRQLHARRLSVTQYMQKKDHDKYDRVKEDTSWTMEKLKFVQLEKRRTNCCHLVNMSTNRSEQMSCAVFRSTG